MAGGLDGIALQQAAVAALIDAKDDRLGGVRVVAVGIVVGGRAGVRRGAP